MNRNLYHQLSEQVEREWDVGGLADGIEDGFYERFAFEVASLYCAQLEEEIAEKDDYIVCLEDDIKEAREGN